MQEEMIHAQKMQGYIAKIGITASTLRGLGGGGFVREARRFLSEDLDLKSLLTLEPSSYSDWLESETRKLEARFGRKKKLWGPARKSINIFMVMASLNYILRETYRLDRLEHVLEVPLDSKVGRKLGVWGVGKGIIADDAIPEWDTVKRLEEKESANYQLLAKARAKELGIPRGRLDVEIWADS